MTKFTVDITDKAALLGITAAREAYNAALPTQRDEDGDVITPTPGTLSTDVAYMQMVMAGAAASYARQYEMDVDVLRSKRDAIEGKIADVVGKGG